MNEIRKGMDARTRLTGLVEAAEKEGGTIPGHYEHQGKSYFFHDDIKALLDLIKVCTGDRVKPAAMAVETRERDGAVVYKHPAQGQIVLSSVSAGGGEPLYGSSIPHHKVVCISIHQSSRHRHLNRDWFHPEEMMLELYMSPAQFGEFIASSGRGEGTPCTLTWTTLYGQVPRIKEIEHERSRFTREFEECVKEHTKRFDDVETAMRSIMDDKGGLSVKEKRNILGQGIGAIQGLRGSLPFILDSYNEALEKVTVEAKGEVEAFMLHRLRDTGENGIPAELAHMLPAIEGGK